MPTTFKGFQIKGIDEERIPDPREAGTYPVGSSDINFRRYSVYLILEPIRDSGEDQIPSIDSNIRQIWGDFFTDLAEKWTNRFRSNWQEWRKGQDIPSVSLKYCDNGDYGKICMEETHFDEVEQWSDSLKRELVAETNIRTLKYLDERETLKEKAREINSRCFSN